MDFERDNCRQVENMDTSMNAVWTTMRYGTACSGKGTKFWTDLRLRTRSELEKLAEDNIKTAVEITLRRIITRTVEEAIETEFTVGLDEPREGIEITIRNQKYGGRSFDPHH